MQEQTLSLNSDGEGRQRRGTKSVQQQTVVGLGILSLSATTTGVGGPQGAFAPLAVDAPLGFGNTGPDWTSFTVASGDSSVSVVNGEGTFVNGKSRDQIAQDVLSSVNSSVPDAASLTQQIVANAPTAESIRAGITAPTAPTAP